MQVVAVYDGTLAPFPANFFQMMPGPDGKIYIISSYANNILHVIHHPDSLGLELVTLLAEKLDGSTELRSGAGTEWRIRFQQLQYSERV
jgi:hypothetical protein